MNIVLQIRRTSTIFMLFVLTLIFFIGKYSSINLNIQKPDNKFVLDLEKNQNNQFCGTVFVGSNFQKLNVIFSTGSALSWISSSNCNNCFNENDIYSKGYNNNSVDLKISGESKKIKYESGEIQGSFAKDLISLNENQEKIDNQLLNFNFFLVNSINKTSSDVILREHGVIGLGLENIKEKLNFISQLHSQGQILSTRFSIYFSQYKNSFSKLYLGDFSKGTLISSVYQQMSFCKTEDKSEIWSCDLNKIELNRTSLASTSKVSIKIESEYLTIPLIDYKIIKKYFVDVAKSECVRSETNILLCKCSSPSIFPDIKLYINNSPFHIISKNIIEYDHNITYQCKFKIQIDMENEDLWTLGTAVLSDTLLSFDIDKRTIGFVQSPINFNSNLNTENIIIHENEQENTKVGFIFAFGFLLVLMYGLTRCAKNDNFMSGNYRNSLTNENSDDKRKMELIKNKFNTDEYDYDEMKRVSSEYKGRKIVNYEMKEINTDFGK